MTTLQGHVERDGFAFVAADDMRPLLDECAELSDWARFAESWNDLHLDTYLPDGHRYRYRRHATLSARAGETKVTLEPHQPHYQSVDYNSLVGGIERWFEPIQAEILSSQSMQCILALCCRLFGTLRPNEAWKIECHQFRIEARSDAPGQPTPEGVHRDGVDYALVLLINRTNIRSGTTTVHDLDGHTLGSFTLTAPLDAAIVDDARVKHGVTAVEPIDPRRAAYRDVLVVTFTAVNEVR
ncbi:MAG TPA: 2OG-Fe dioxygenase family protein [Burkholderiaceae bacterium]|nr:2OG-Fe dioxygenase family protein [Burkholderiaceae bacterium]